LEKALDHGNQEIMGLGKSALDKMKRYLWYNKNVDFLCAQIRGIAMNEVCGGIHIVQKSSKKESHHALTMKASWWEPIGNAAETHWEFFGSTAKTQCEHSGNTFGNRDKLEENFEL
jgi:hypothetical protein